MQAPKPLLLSFLMCDGVHVDRATGKYTLLGIFTSLKARQFPAQHPRCYAFVLLTDCQPGAHKLGLGCFPTDEEETYLVEREFEVSSPLDRVQLVCEIQNLEFKAPTEHTLQLEIDGEPLLVMPFDVGEAAG